MYYKMVQNFRSFLQSVLCTLPHPWRSHDALASRSSGPVGRHARGLLPAAGGHRHAAEQLRCRRPRRDEPRPRPLRGGRAPRDHPLPPPPRPAPQRERSPGGEVDALRRTSACHKQSHWGASTFPLVEALVTKNTNIGWCFLFA